MIKSRPVWNKGLIDRKHTNYYLLLQCLSVSLKYLSIKNVVSVVQTWSLGTFSCPSQEHKPQCTLIRTPIPEAATINISIISISSNNSGFANWYITRQKWVFTGKTVACWLAGFLPQTGLHLLKVTAFDTYRPTKQFRDMTHFWINRA